MDERTQISLVNAARLLDSAEEALAQAQDMMLPQNRLQMLKLAETYQHMAEVALRYSRFRNEADNGRMKLAKT